jgi:hypothetical protein
MVIIDHPGSDKGNAVCLATELRAPDLDPMEQVSAKLKIFLCAHSIPWCQYRRRRDAQCSRSQ